MIVQEDWATPLLVTASECEEEVGHDVETGTDVRGSIMPESKLPPQTGIEETLLQPLSFRPLEYALLSRTGESQPLCAYQN